MAETTQQYLYRIRPTRPEMLSEGATVEEDALVDQHFGYLQALTRQGAVILAGRTLNTDVSSFGIVIFAAASDAEARALMLADPAVRAGIFCADLFPFRVALQNLA